ncbi:MAG: hypothetical protein RLZZ176_1651 [Cyanobacteriota bacterium]
MKSKATEMMVSTILIVVGEKLRKKDLSCDQTTITVSSNHKLCSSYLLTKLFMTYARSNQKPDAFLGVAHELPVLSRWFA